MALSQFRTESLSQAPMKSLYDGHGSSTTVVDGDFGLTTDGGPDVSEIMDDVDENHDVKVSKGEVIKCGITKGVEMALDKVLPPAGLIDMPFDMYASFDADKDNRLNKEELKPFAKTVEQMF